MRLLDQVAQARAPCVIEDDLGTWRMPAAVDRAATVADVPLRYVLQPQVAARCRQLLRTDRGMLSPHNGLLRASAPRLWIEWAEERRAGLLIDADASGRSGTIEVFWEQARDEPTLAQATLSFDFDHVMPATVVGSSTFQLSADQHPLADHLRFSIPDGWMRHLFANGAAIGRHAVATICANVLADAEMLFAFSPLLLHRPEIDLTPAALDRINRQRLRRGRPELLDHLDVALCLDRAGVGSAVALHPSRTARLHLVRGHMVQRQDRMFWRRSHLRGDMTRPIASRTVHVR